MSKNKEEKEFFTTAELAEFLGISRIAVFNKIQKGQIKAQKMGRNFVIFKKDLESFEASVDLLRMATEWAVSGKEIPEQCYSQNSARFQGRLSKMEYLLMNDQKTKNIFSLLTSVSGEIGNNSYDHNIGRWPDIPGIFFWYDLEKRQIVLADRGVGILESLKAVKPELINHKQALETAFTQVLSGRAPESRGNGLKFTRRVVLENPVNLFFQSGDAYLELKGQSNSFEIKTSKQNIRGCIASITY